MSSSSADLNDEICSPTFKAKDDTGYTDDTNPNIDVCGDDDCVIIKVVERTPLYKMCGHKLQTREDTDNLQPTISQERGLNICERNTCYDTGSIFPAQPGQEQLRRNPKRLAKQLNNRKRRLESKYDFSYIPAHKFAAKRKRILKCTKEIQTHIDNNNQNKLLVENKDARAHPPCNKTHEKTAENFEEQVLNKVRTRSRCAEASEFAPPSPEKFWEWREWPAEGMHERPVYQDAQDKKHLQEVAHHALHAVLAFCVMVCSQKTSSNSAHLANNYLKNFVSSKKYSEAPENSYNARRHNNNSTSDLMMGKEVSSSCYTKSSPVISQSEELVHVSSSEADNSKVLDAEENMKINNEVKHIRDQKIHCGKDLENILNSSNSSTVSGDSGDLIIAENENEDENGQESILPILCTEKSLNYNDKSLTEKSNDHFISLMKQNFKAQSSCAGFAEEHKDGTGVLREKLCKWKRPVPVATRSELHILRQGMKKLCTEELPKTMNDSVTLEELQDLINYTALLYCLVCSVPQSALAHYINSLTPSSILEWLTEVSQNMTE